MRRLARPLLFGGIVGIVFGLAKVHAAYVADPAYDFTGSSRFAWTIAYGSILLVATYGAGLPDQVRTVRQAVIAAIAATAVSALAVSIVQLVSGDALLPRFVVFGSAIAIVPWSLVCASLAHGARLRAEARDRVLLVADDAEALLLRDELDGRPERPFSLLNHLGTDAARSTGNRSQPLVALAKDVRVNLLVVDRECLDDPSVVAQVASLHESGVRVRTLAAFYEEWLGKLPVSELERASLLFDIREVHGGPYLRMKRFVDVAVGLVGAVPLAVAVPFVLIGNRLANQGPLLYRQERVGKLGERFTIFKFRTMRSDDGAASTWTTVDDPRITPFGRILRQTHLDELPQVINILRGELSVVGPRPEQPRYVDELVEKLPFYAMRHLVQPGLTGWAQVKYGYAGDERDALEKLQYEFWYLRHQGARTDTRIVARTIRSVLGSEGKGR